MSETTEFQIGNRGTFEVPFGFVYLEGTRVGFADDSVWPTNGWPSSYDQRQRVAEYLTEFFGSEYVVE